jgi:hypothetical protein
LNPCSLLVPPRDPSAQAIKSGDQAAANEAANKAAQQAAEAADKVLKSGGSPAAAAEAAKQATSTQVGLFSCSPLWLSALHPPVSLIHAPLCPAQYLGATTRT